MLNSKNLTIVTISTILFGVLSKWLVGIPYMSLKHFDLYFVISFILWVIYSASLYAASKVKCNGSDNFIRISFGDSCLMSENRNRFTCTAGS